MLRDVRIQAADFSVGDEIDALRGRLAGEVGALSLFCGLVRDRHAGDAVDALELEHYPGMTEASIGRILDRAESRWPLQASTVVHRVGRLAAGDQIVLVLVAGAHRKAALDSTAFIIDFLKTDAVLWKKEIKGHTERWVESRSDDYERADNWRSR